MVRVLLTGATGFVGGRTADRLRVLGHEVVAPVRSRSVALAELGVEQLPGGFDAVTRTAVADAAVVVHAAATAGPDLTTAREVNVAGTRRLWESARVAGSERFVHVSTTSVYAPPDPDVPLVDETAPLVGDDDEAASPYARTKAAAERLLLADEAAAGPVVILRPPAVLGAGPTSTWGTRVPAAIRDGGGFPQPRAATFAFVHVDDLVDAIVAAAGLDGDAGTTPAHGGDAPVVANVVGGHVTVGDYLDAVVALLPTPVPERPGTDAMGWTGRYATDRLPRRFGIAPHRSFRTGMAEIADAWAGSENGQEDGR